jgi:hypothetical protein
MYVSNCASWISFFVLFVFFVVESQFNYTSQIPDRTLKLTRMGESRNPERHWMPVFTGMTVEMMDTHFCLAQDSALRANFL